MNTEERDREIAATWRAASRDEPPAALDDAIRAAARRAVGAGPSRARHMRTWPLAAAAVMAVFAVGLLQLTPPEQVTPGMETDLSLLRQKAQSEEKPAGASAPVITGAARSDAPVEVASNAAAGGSAKRDAVGAAPAAPTPSDAAPSSPGVSTPASVAALEKRNPAIADAPKRSAGGADAPDQERVVRFARKELAQAPAPPVVAQAPDARMREQARPDVASATTERRELDQKNKQEAGGSTPPSVTASEPQAQAKTRADPFPTTAAQDKVAAGAAPAAPPPPAILAAPAATPAPAPPVPAVAPPMTALNRPAPAPAEAAGSLSARRDVAPAAMPQKLAKDTAPRPADEWIRLIRKLQSEGRNDDAMKELTAFRAAYKERADALLPADLRAIKP